VVWLCCPLSTKTSIFFMSASSIWPPMSSGLPLEGFRSLAQGPT
jgi:hypothetical protein